MTLDICTSDLLTPIKHGYYTRRGGASAGIFQGLNCGQGSTDQDDIVALNRNLVAKSLDVPIENLLSLHQIHSNEVVEVTEPWKGKRPQADAMVSRSRGVALGILTADCAPILFADISAGIIGAAHAGWKGALGGVIAATVTAMQDIGAAPDRIKATIGPTISQSAYEVGQEFFETFLAWENSFSRFFAQGKSDRMQFDLPGFCLHQLRQAGVAQCDWTGHCTFSDPDRFYSYRRATHAGQADYGRQISVITL